MSRTGHEADAPTVAALLPTASPAEARRAAAGLLGAHRLSTALAAIVVLGGAVAGLVVPPLLGAIVDAVIDGDATTVDLLVLALVVAVVAEGTLGGLTVVVVARIGETALAGLREAVVERALALPLGLVERAGVGDLVARVSGDVDDVSGAFREALPALLRAGLTVGLTVVGLAVLDWRLALAGLAVAPLHVVATRWYLRRSSPVYAAERIALGTRTARLAETLSGHDTVRALGLGDDHRRRVGDASVAAVERSLLAARIRSRFGCALNGAELVGLASVLGVGFLLVRADTVSVGTAAAAALYFHRLFNPFNELLGLLDTAQDAAAAFARLVGVTQVAPLRGPARPTVPVDASVRLEGVHFSYAEGGDATPDVLHDVDLVIAPGTRTAVVGASGAGKSTVAKLVAGIHAAGQGSVLLGGRTPDELGPATTRATVALVTQEVHVFAGTVADDLRLAAPAATDAELLAALDAVGARAWVEGLPDGLATVVGDGGHPVDPLAAQRLALARVVLTDVAVVVLDEATAEAGSQGARRLEAAAAAALAGRTALVVAHRLTQAATADQIVVMDRGRVVERGPHAVLVAADGPYARLWAAWSTGR